MFLKIFFLFFSIIITHNNGYLEKENKKPKINKRKNIDIDILRESLLEKLMELLKKLELYFSKLNKKNINDLLQELLNIFHWVNEQIKLFMDDPTVFNRKKLEASLAKIEEYDTILNNMKTI